MQVWLPLYQNRLGNYDYLEYIETKLGANAFIMNPGSSFNREKTLPLRYNDFMIDL